MSNEARNLRRQNSLRPNPNLWRAWIALPAVVQIPLVVVVTSNVAWRFETEKMDLFKADTKYNINQPWRVLTNSFVHQSTNHLLDSTGRWIPLALATSVDYLLHGQGHVTRKRTWSVFLALIVLSNVIHHIVRQAVSPDERYVWCGSFRPILGMYGYSFASLPSAIRRIFVFPVVGRRFLIPVKQIIIFVYSLGVFVLDIYSLYGLLEISFNVDEAIRYSTLLSIAAGMVISMIFPYEDVSPTIWHVLDRLSVGYSFKKKINVLDPMFSPVDSFFQLFLFFGG